MRLLYLIPLEQKAHISYLDKVGYIRHSYLWDLDTLVWSGSYETFMEDTE